MILQISNLQDKFEVTEALETIITQVVKETQSHEGLKDELEISIALVDDAYIRELNNDYRNKDCPTDVLSFAFRDTEDEINYEDFEDGLDEEAEILGDVVISLETAKRQAEEFGHSFEREVAFLTVHGLLHLLGYDHLNEAEEKLMQTKQEAVLRALNITR